MSLTESIVEDAALEWFLLRQGYGGHVGELVPYLRDIGHGPQQFNALATLRDKLLSKLLSGELTIQDS